MFIYNNIYHKSIIIIIFSKWQYNNNFNHIHTIQLSLSLICTEGRRIKLYNAKPLKLSTKTIRFKQTLRTCLTFTLRESIKYLHLLVIKTASSYFNLYMTPQSSIWVCNQKGLNREIICQHEYTNRVLEWRLEYILKPVS